MIVVRSLALFLVAALAEIGGAWLVWQGIREHRGWIWVGAGVIALGLYGFVATLQPDPHFGRILAAYGGIFVAGSLAWAMIIDGFRPRPLGPRRRPDLPSRRLRDHVRPPRRLLIASRLARSRRSCLRLRWRLRVIVGAAAWCLGSSLRSCSPAVAAGPGEKETRSRHADRRPDQPAVEALLGKPVVPVPLPATVAARAGFVGRRVACSSRNGRSSSTLVMRAARGCRSPHEPALGRRS